MQYKIIVDKQSRTNPSNEKKEYIIEIEELRRKGDIADTLVITKDEDYVMRRLSLSEYHVLKVLDEPIKQPLQDINIQLFEGDNYIYLFDMTGNKFYAEYLIKNDFNDTYITKSEAHSAINQSAHQIELTVSETLTNYATNEEVENNITQLSSEITQTATEISTEVSKKVGNDEIISKINQSAEKISINADKIDIIGKKVKFKTNTETQYTYSQSDIEKIKQHIIGTTTLTQAQIDLYDINNDGRISASDYTMIKNKITDNGGTFTYKGSFEINPDSVNENIIIRDENGSVITSIGLYRNENAIFRN